MWSSIFKLYDPVNIKTDVRDMGRSFTDSFSSRAEQRVGGSRGRNGVHLVPQYMDPRGEGEGVFNKMYTKFPNQFMILKFHTDLKLKNLLPLLFMNISLQKTFKNKLPLYAQNKNIFFNPIMCKLTTKAFQIFFLLFYIACIISFLSWFCLYCKLLLFKVSYFF